MPSRLNTSELLIRLLPRSGGQGVAGSNPAVPTQVRRLTRSSGPTLCPIGTKIERAGTLLALLDRWSRTAAPNHAGRTGPDCEPRYLVAADPPGGLASACVRAPGGYTG
jgi:hypothetical protein